jgi:hypothetical protein
MAEVSPQECKRFETCGAPICPLDPCWHTGCHLPGERVCAYLLGSGKQGAANWYASDPLFAAVR